MLDMIILLRSLMRKKKLKAKFNDFKSREAELNLSRNLYYANVEEIVRKESWQMETMKH